MKTTIHLKLGNIFKRPFCISMLIMILLIGCRPSSDAPTQGGMIPQGAEPAGAAVAVAVAEELGESTRSCAQEYETEGDKISDTEKETNLLNCLIETTHGQVDKNGDYPHVLINISVEGRIDERLVFEDLELRGQNEYDVVIPFSLGDDHSVLFQTGLDIFVYVPNYFNETTSSMDMAVRYTGGLMIRFSVGNGAIGVNAFYDSQAPSVHHRVSGGLDYIDDNNKVSLNYYHPLSGWVDINDFRRERAMGGFDIRYERTIGIVSLYLQGELFFTGHDYTLFVDPEKAGGTQAALGLGLGVNFNCRTRVSMGIDARKKDISLSNVNLENIDLGLKLGLRQFVGRNCEQASHSRAERAEKDREINVLREEM